MLSGEMSSWNVFEFRSSEIAEFHWTVTSHGIEKLQAEGQTDIASAYTQHNPSGSVSFQRGLQIKAKHRQKSKLNL